MEAGTKGEEDASIAVASTDGTVRWQQSAGVVVVSLIEPVPAFVLVAGVFFVVQLAAAGAEAAVVAFEFQGVVSQGFDAAGLAIEAAAAVCADPAVAAGSGFDDDAKKRVPAVAKRDPAALAHPPAADAVGVAAASFSSLLAPEPHEQHSESHA